MPRVKLAVVPLLTAVFVATDLHSTVAEDAIPVSDLSGTWARQAFFFEPPPSGPGPVGNRARLSNGHSNLSQLVGDYTNPILKPHAAQIVRERGKIALAGATAPDPSNQCLPMFPPYILGEEQEIQILQQKDQITILYMADHQVRRVRMNAQHPVRVKPTWSGDSVGRYEGNTLLVDTVGIKTGPLSMVDWFGTPHTGDLHLVERYRLIDYSEAKKATERAIADQGYQLAGALSEGVMFDPNYMGKGLQIQFTVEDSAGFNKPWSATLTYRRGGTEWQESVCAENQREYYANRDTAIPAAGKRDF